MYGKPNQPAFLCPQFLFGPIYDPLSDGIGVRFVVDHTSSFRYSD
jgi:hypothetical protein